MRPGAASYGGMSVLEPVTRPGPSGTSNAGLIPAIGPGGELFPIGKLKAHREGTTRLYARRDIARLKLILLGRKVGFSLRDCARVRSAVSPNGDAKMQLFDYIEVFYNRIRRHSALDYLSPAEFESAQLT